MTDNEAKALGRWCPIHDRKHERVTIGSSVVTGCRECLTGDGETAVAFREMLEDVQQRYTW